MGGCQKLLEITDELGETLLREEDGPRARGRHPRRRVQGLRREGHWRKRQAGIPHEAGYPDQSACQASPRQGSVNLAIVKKGEGEIPGLTDNTIPRRLGPKRASK